ncbi:DGAT1/2-independent enzyme synthesizing storage lipids-like [Pituophis catenifer annectens]|uniref:DGAT1/2-independent enzyme synthesizing storage lipids-like n=1 Tax=Pituophis catenifer annectens TaxID=94852 RepID=UPI003993DE51
MNSTISLPYIYGEWLPLGLEKYFIYAVLSPVLALMVVPVWIFFYVYLSVFIILFYEMSSKAKEEAQRSYYFILGHLWDFFGRIWHGYELHGVENLPDGPGLIIYYHAPLPIDYIFFLARIFFLKNRLCCHTVVDHFVFKLPGLKMLGSNLKMITGSKEECLHALNNGDWVAISPGGTREAIFSDETYNILWGKRTGFAKVALEARVPIIPMFTENSREGYKILGRIKPLKDLYEYVRWPLIILYGGFPVKWRTHIGKPIPYDPNITVEELVKKAQNALQTLIEKNQKQPGCIRSGLLARFHNKKKE